MPSSTGKGLFLVRLLVTAQPWGQKYAERAGTVVLDDVEDVLRRSSGCVLMGYLDEHASAFRRFDRIIAMPGYSG